VLAAAGLGLFTQAPVGGTYVTDLLPSMVLVGIGAGLSFPAVMTLAMSGAEPSQAGLATGLVNTTQQVGGALGHAVLATLASTHTTTLLHQGKSAAPALVGGYHFAWLVGTALLLAAVVAAVTILRPAPAATQGEQDAQPGVPAEAQVAYSEAA
jgi:MFS family permease